MTVVSGAHFLPVTVQVLVSHRFARVSLVTRVISLVLWVREHRRFSLNLLFTRDTRDTRDNAVFTDGFVTRVRLG